MTTTIPSTALAAIQPVFTDAERLALAGFLAGYRGLTREGPHPRPAPSTWRPESAPKARSLSPRTGGGWTGTAPPGSSAG